MTTSTLERTVYVVDDEQAIISSLSNLLSAEGYTVSAFTSPQVFLSHPHFPAPCCLIVDLNMPDMNGLEVTRQLRELGYAIPAIFLTGYGTIPVTVQAMKAGAYEFLTKPVLPDPLLVAVADALAFSEAEMAAAEEKRELIARARTLTQRENEVMQLVVTGLLNKQIAAQMGISEITAKVHKRRVMEKMKMRTLSDLVKATEKLNHDKDKHSQG